RWASSSTTRRSRYSNRIALASPLHASGVVGSRARIAIAREAAHAAADRAHCAALVPVVVAGVVSEAVRGAVAAVAADRRVRARRPDVAVEDAQLRLAAIDVAGASLCDVAVELAAQSGGAGEVAGVGDIDDAGVLVARAADRGAPGIAACAIAARRAS